MNTKWIAIGTIGTLGLGAIAASAAGVANAVALRDANGRVLESSTVRGDLLERGAVSIKTTGDHASVISAASAADAASADAPSATQSAVSPTSVQSPATEAPKG